MKTYVNTYVSKMIMNFRAWISGSFIAAAFCCLADDGSTAYNFLDVTSSSRVRSLHGLLPFSISAMVKSGVLTRLVPISVHSVQRIFMSQVRSDMI